MTATRTQIYLTERQRRLLDERQRREGKSMAALVREAIDAYVGEPKPDIDAALETTFGALRLLEVPSRSEWQPRDRRLG